MRTTALLLVLAVLATTIHAVKLNNEAGFSLSATVSSSSYYSQTLTNGSAYVIKNYGTNNYISVGGNPLNGYKLTPSQSGGTVFNYTQNSDGTGYLTTYAYKECVWAYNVNAGMDLCVLNYKWTNYLGCANPNDKTDNYDVCNNPEINIINLGVDWGVNYYSGDIYLQANDGSGLFFAETSGSYSVQQYNTKWVFYQVS